MLVQVDLASGRGFVGKGDAAISGRSVADGAPRPPEPQERQGQFRQLACYICAMLTPHPIGTGYAAVIEPKLSALDALCRRFAVHRLDVFGSAVDGRLDPRAQRYRSPRRIRADAARRLGRGIFRPSRRARNPF
jgi:hypothetical protein